MLRFFRVLAGTAIVVAWSSLAAAAPTLTPPRPLTSITAPYPDGASGAGSVVLTIVIAPDGEVTSGEVSEGDPSFGAAALAAMHGWRFEPARRDGVAVTARIRVRVDFTPPPATPVPVPVPVPVPAPAPAPAPPPAPAPAPPPPIEVVNVHIPPPAIGRTAVHAEEIRDLPGAFGEPARVLESLPGVSPYASGLPFMSVRGAMPSATTYTLDGVRLPAFFHYGLGVSTFHPALLDGFDFFSGAAPARDGHGLSFVEATTRAPAGRTHAEASVRAIDSSALVETPLADGKGSFLIAGRYGYPGPIVRIISPETHLEYANYQARATWSFDHAGTLTVLLLGIHDVYDTTDGGLSGVLETADAWSHRIDVRYDVDVRGGGHARVGVTFGNDDDAAYLSSIRSVQGRAEVDVPLSESVRVRGGLDAYASWLSIDVPGGDAAQNVAPAAAFRSAVERVIVNGPSSNRLQAGAWADVVLRPARGVELVPGVRVDDYQGDYFTGAAADPSAGSPTFRMQSADFAKPFVSPRLAARAALAPDLALVASGGMATRAATAAFPVLASEYLTEVTSNPVEKSTMLDIGFQARLPGDVSLRAVAFQSSYRDMTLFPVCLSASVCQADGAARGVELMARRDLGHRLGGWISYTLTKAKLHAPGFPEFDDPLERRHQLNAVASYDLGAGVRLGARAVFYTGAPFATTTWYSGADVQNEALTPYPQRPSPFWRVDVRLEKRWRLSDTSSVAVAFDWLNATLNREPEEICAVQSGGAPVCHDSLRPALSAPSVTVEGQL